jgi:hypothetical protein
MKTIIEVTGIVVELTLIAIIGNLFVTLLFL